MVGDWTLEELLQIMHREGSVEGESDAQDEAML